VNDGLKVQVSDTTNADSSNADGNKKTKAIIETCKNNGWYMNCFLVSLNYKIMKNILIAAVVVGITAAGLILYLRDRVEADDEFDEVEDAAGDAYTTMNRNIGKAERAVRNAVS